MRRKDREITSMEEIKDIIKEALFCNIAMCRSNIPYLVPMNFGFDGQYFYLHSAPEGLKLDILKENPRVCIEITQDLKIIPSTDVCKTGMKYSSVIVSGRIEFLSDKAERIDALRCIIKHLYKDMTDNGENGIQFNEEHLDGLVIIRVKPEKITGKWSA